MFLKKNINNISKINLLIKIIEQCCKIKSRIIEIDERDTRERKKLNFGHTIGHPIEAINKLRHGEAVGYGMICACIISKELKTLKEESFNDIISLIKKLSLPKVILDVDKIMLMMKKDKKIENDAINFILLNEIGNSYISNNVSNQIIKKSILSI